MRHFVLNRSILRRAFSLIELMVVILIIALVIAILLPALRGARTTAKVAATQATMRDLGSATNTFTLDKKTAPGYFSASLMGSNTNEGIGFTAMKNVLLDLAGGITKAPTNGTTIIATGPGAGATGQVNVDLSLIGAKGGSGGGYFTADKGNFAPGVGLVGSDAATIANVPEVMDAFGQPIMAWVADTRPDTQFAAKTSGTGYIAKFYWASNAGVLKSTALGKEGKQQAWASGDDYCSMIGYGNQDQAVVGRGVNGGGSLESLLGNPSFPRNGVTPARPEKARGEVVFHSAGPDGYFMGKGDKGTKMHWNTVTRTSVPYVAGTDVMRDYDDLVQTANN